MARILTTLGRCTHYAAAGSRRLAEGARKCAGRNYLFTLVAATLCFVTYRCYIRAGDNASVYDRLINLAREELRNGAVPFKPGMIYGRPGDYHKDDSLDMLDKVYPTFFIQGRSRPTIALIYLNEALRLNGGGIVPSEFVKPYTDEVAKLLRSRLSETLGLDNHDDGKDARLVNEAFDIYNRARSDFAAQHGIVLKADTRASLAFWPVNIPNIDGDLYLMPLSTYYQYSIVLKARPPQNEWHRYRSGDRAYLAGSYAYYIVKGNGWPNEAARQTEPIRRSTKELKLL